MNRRKMVALLVCAFALSIFTVLATGIRSTSANTTVPTIENHDNPEDYVWDSSSAIPIALNGDTIATEASGAVVEGSTVTLTAAGTYTISGTLTDGQIIVNTEDTALVRLILNGVDIHSSTTAPIHVMNAEEVMVVLADNTDNRVSDGTSYLFDTVNEDEPNAAIFSRSDLTFYGNGALTVTGNYNDGIASKDGLVITSGSITVNVVDDGIRGKDYLIIHDGQITVNAQGDGLKSDNAEDDTKGSIVIDAGLINVVAGGDAIQAQTNVTIQGGEYTLLSGGGSGGWIDETQSAKGIKATGVLTINNGIFAINSADDAIHANDSIIINNGTFALATGDDAVHGDLAIEINGGYIIITTSYEGIEGKSITVNDGTIYLTANDDGFNAADGTGGMGGHGGGGMMVGDYSLTINGGYIVLNTGGDGFDSNGIADMTGGTLLVNGPTNNVNGAIDVNGTFNVTGGFLVAVGSSGMAEAPSETSSQYSMRLNFDWTLPAGTLVHIESSDGNEILTFAAAKEFQSIVVSSPEFSAGATYTISYSGEASGVASDGLYPDGSYSGGTLHSSFTVSSMVTSLGAVNTMGGPGGRQGRGGGN
jgi:hypothetical protein